MKLFTKSLAALSFLFLFAMTANAGGFEGPGSPIAITRAQEIHHAHGATPCILEGRIIEKLNSRKDYYVFQDNSGQVNVQIKRDVFGNRTITPSDLVRISGIVETDGRYPQTLEVESLGVLDNGSKS